MTDEPRRRGRPPAPGTPAEKAARKQLRTLHNRIDANEGEREMLMELLRDRIDANERERQMLMTARDTLIFNLAQRETLSFEEIGRAFGVTRQYAHQIARRRRAELGE